MDWIYRVMLFALVVSVGAAAESWIICRVYKLGQADGWAAARALYRDWRRSGALVSQKADAA